MKDSANKPTDLRAQRQREQRRLFWTVVAFLVIVGTSVIALVYGPPAAVASCIAFSFCFRQMGRLLPVAFCSTAT